MYRPTTKNEWWVCSVLVTQAIVTIALETYMLLQWQSWVTPTIIQVAVSYVVPINLAILIFACVYEFILTLDAIHHKNNMLLFAICISNICSFVYAVMQYHLMETTTARLLVQRVPILVDTTRDIWPLIQPAEIIVCIVTGLGTLIMLPCVYFLHREYSWAIYKCVHGDRKTRMRYLFYEIFLVLMKLNFYFLIGFIIHYNLIRVHFPSLLEYKSTMCLIPAAFICMLLGIYFVQQEKTWGVISVIICYLGLIAYLISRIIFLCGDDTAGKDMMLLFAFVSLALTTAIVVCAIVCITNFDRGFKKINRSKNGAQDAYSLQTGDLPISHPSYRPPSRLTLD